MPTFTNEEHLRLHLQDPKKRKKIKYIKRYVTNINSILTIKYLLYNGR